MLMINAVQSCHAITEEESNDLVEKIGKLAITLTQKEDLKFLDEENSRIYVVGRTHTKNPVVFNNIASIRKAIGGKKQISFKYSKNRIRVDKSDPKTINKEVTVTPIRIVYDEGFYYVGSWNESDNKMHDYRLDRMTDIEILQDNAINNAQIKNYLTDEKENSYAVFGRYKDDGKSEVHFSVQNNKQEIIIDRFGDYKETGVNRAKKDEANESDDRTILHEQVYKGDQFYGWVASMGGTVQIDYPKDLIEDYCNYLEARLAEAKARLKNPFTKKVNRIR